MPRRQDEYHPNSVDASFAKLFTRMDHQDNLLIKILEAQREQDRDIAKLKRDKLKDRLMSLMGLTAAGHEVASKLLQ